jgi:hypothetical protein
MQSCLLLVLTCLLTVKPLLYRYLNISNPKKVREFHRMSRDEERMARSEGEQKWASRFLRMYHESYLSSYLA